MRRKEDEEGGKRNSNTNTIDGRVCHCGEIKAPGSSPDPKIIDDVIGLLHRLMLPHPLAISHYHQCYYIKSSAQRQRPRWIANLPKADVIPALNLPP